MNPMHLISYSISLCLLFFSGASIGQGPTQTLKKTPLENNWLIGTEYEGGRYVFDVSHQIGSVCSKENNEIIFTAWMKKIDRVGKLTNPNNQHDTAPVPFTQAGKIGITIPIEVKNLVAKNWFVADGSIKDAITLEPMAIAIESNGPCWVLATPNWNTDGAYPIYKNLVIASVENLRSVRLVKPRQANLNRETMTDDARQRFKAASEKVPELNKNIKTFLREHDLTLEKSELWQFQSFRAAVAGKNEEFLIASVYNEGWQFNTLINTSRNLLCRWHAEAEDSVYGWQLKAVFDPYRKGTDYWAVQEWYYEGANDAIVFPSIEWSKCQMKTVLRTAYSGL
jgi:hypothetical protein